MVRNESASNISWEKVVSITRLQVAAAIPSEEQWDVRCVCVRLCSRAGASKSLEECFCHAVHLWISCIDEGWLLILPISVRDWDGAVGQKRGKSMSL